MAEAAKPKAPAKKAPAKASSVKKSILQDVENELKSVAGDVKADVEAEVSRVEAKVDPLVEQIKGKTFSELKEMHLQALYAEDAIKRELHVLRLRAANMATTVDDEVDKQIADLKGKLTEAVAWLKVLESGLFGQLRDIWGTRY